MTTPDLPPVCCGRCVWFGRVGGFMVGDKLRECASEQCELYEVLMRKEDGTGCPAFQGTEEGTET